MQEQGLSCAGRGVAIIPPGPPKIWLPRTGLAPPHEAREYCATLEEVIQATPDVRRFRLTLDGYREIMPFIAGQFVQMLCPIPEKDEPHKIKKVIRAYSIASPPEEKRFLEFCVKLVLKGTFTPTLWTMHLGDKIDLRGPYGKFVVQEPINGDLLFISAGTGIAPFWSIIHHLLKSGVKREIVSISGARYEEDVLYRKEFEQLAAEHPNFRPIYTLSRPRHPETWSGETGYVQALLHKFVKNPTTTRAYLCGLKAMIQHSAEELERLGFPKDRIHYERYD